MNIMDSLYVILVENRMNTRILVKLSQKTPNDQINRLMKMSMYNTASSFSEILLENDFEKLSQQEHI